MPAYEPDFSEQPAPVARVTFRNPASGASVADVRMLLDTGADVSLMPRSLLGALGINEDNLAQCFEMSGFDANRSVSPVAIVQMHFLSKDFTGRFLLSDTEYGIIGRNILNSLRLVFDGLSQTWDEAKLP